MPKTDNSQFFPFTFIIELFQKSADGILNLQQIRVFLAAGDFTLSKDSLCGLLFRLKKKGIIAGLEKGVYEYLGLPDDMPEIKTHRKKNQELRYKPTVEEAALALSFRPGSRRQMVLRAIAVAPPTVKGLNARDIQIILMDKFKRFMLVESIKNALEHLNKKGAIMHTQFGRYQLVKE